MILIKATYLLKFPWHY